MFKSLQRSQPTLRSVLAVPRRRIILPTSVILEPSIGITEEEFDPADVVPFDLQLPPSSPTSALLSAALGCTNLTKVETYIEEVSMPLAHTVTGALVGRHHQPYFYFPVSVHDCPLRFVHFLYAPVSPYTLLARDVCELLYGGEDGGDVTVPTFFRATLGGRMAEVRPVPVNARFSGISVLGADFCLLHGAVAMLDYNTKVAKLVFGQE
ncbi:hypothetical protein BZA05DRAFT_444087 [Tricharina praecox]|uniref:uncharacterized protein n=1 Tax=Tricharina praecox TaxID=43433 RepID=UPI00221F482D|nr:uncharacterized protein BZA05DRAFT_444087 [Tricharina praecox]KAI5853804.1 hypothetical protein BZA05DRAFT_444087 [Tricharina praecox]